jgi:hypothetical protein
VTSYRVILNVPFQPALLVSELLAEHRGEIGTRAGTRALTCWNQAVFALARFRDRPGIRRRGRARPGEETGPRRARHRHENPERAAAFPRYQSERVEHKMTAGWAVLIWWTLVPARERSPSAAIRGIGG